VFDFISSHLTHIYWAVFCVLVAVVVHFWPTIKAWWAARKAAALAEEKRLKALAEVAAGDIEGLYTRIRLDVQGDISALVKQVKALELRIDAQVKADAAKVQTTVATDLQHAALAVDPALAPEAAQVHGWVPPVVQG
jgi:hypothetical protein